MNKNQETNELNCREHIANVVGADASVCPKNHRGITLIALVITIIVMLILVGVTVSIAINGGLFGMAKEAKTQTEKARDVEQELANGRILVGDTWYDSMSDYVNGNRSEDQSEGGTYFKAEKNEDGILTENATYESGGYTATIPAGFKVSEVAGEDKIETGLVIKDKDGNEFVWIPCTKEEYENAKTEDDWGKSDEYKSRTWHDDQTKIGAESIGKYNGFYVARYEAGVPTDAPFYADADGATYNTNRNTTEYKPVSKKGVQAWNHISQVNANTVSEDMYEDNEEVGSYLIDSHAWNLICKNIFENKLHKNIKDSTEWGNYKNNTTTEYEKLNVLYAAHTYEINKENNKWTFARTYSKNLIPSSAVPRGSESTAVLELSTGASEDFKAYNVYDMAGNMWEWTTEITTNGEGSFASQRGGTFNLRGNTRPVVYSGCDGYEKDFSIGFRVVLYLV